MSQHLSDHHWLVNTCIFLILFIVAAFAVLPLVYMFVNTFKLSFEFISDPLGLPGSFANIENYLAMYYRFDVVRLFANTFVYVVLAEMLSLSVSIPASFAFAKLRFPYRDSLYLAMIAMLTIPTITFIIPNYIMMSRVGMVNHPSSVIVLWGIISIPGNTFLLTSLMKGIPIELIEAVRIDGGSYMQLMWYVILPMSIPGITTVTIFNTTAWWNDLLTPLVFLQSDSIKTMTVAVATIVGQFQTDFPLLLTGLLFTAIPPIIIYLALQNQIRKGLVIGSLK